MPPPASIVIPTRARPDYLEVALARSPRRPRRPGAEVIVIDDAGPSPERRARWSSASARATSPIRGPLGLNVARNTGVERSSGELVVFVDDDVRVLPGLARERCSQAARRAPRRGRLHRPDRAAPRGRRRAATRLRARGAADHLARPGRRATRTRATRGARTWRSAAPRCERVGPFDDRARVRRRRAGVAGPPARRHAADARVLYVAGAALDHRRAGDDARLRSLARAAYARGRASRRFDASRRGGAAGPIVAASCSRSAAASGTCFAAAAPPAW